MPQGHVLNYIYSSIFVISRTWRQLKCPAIEEKIMKLWYISTMEYYTTENQNDILKFVGKCMKLKSIIFTEVVQTKKHSFHMYSLIGGF